MSHYRRQAVGKVGLPNRFYLLQETEGYFGSWSAKGRLLLNQDGVTQLEARWMGLKIPLQ